MHGLFIDSPRHAHGTQFSASIKCIYDNDFHLSFYFICSTIFDIVLSNIVKFCQILSKAMYIVYNIYYPTYYIQYIFPLYIAYIIISLLKSIQYYFLIHLTRYILYVLRTLFLITYIPYNCNYKHEKNYFFIFYLTYALKCAFLYTYFYPLVKH